MQFRVRSVTEIPFGILVGCFGFNGPLRQYFSLYRAVSQREGERGEKGKFRVKMSKQPPPAPTASAVGPCPTVIQIVGRPLVYYHDTSQLCRTGLDDVSRRRMTTLACILSKLFSLDGFRCSVVVAL